MRMRISDKELLCISDSWIMCISDSSAAQQGDIWRACGTSLSRLAAESSKAALVTTLNRH